MSQIEQVVREHIVSEYMKGQSDPTISDDQNLIETEIIDSLGIFMLVSFLEEQFGVQIDPEEVTLDNFETVNRIKDLVSAKLGS